MKVYIGNNETIIGFDIVLVPGKNLYTGRNSFLEHFGAITSLEDDLLNLSSAIYATDLAIKRAELENYIRDIEFSIEVVNIHAFERIHDILAEALYTLSCDNWVIKFIHVKGESENKLDITVNDGVVLLFSGGLDSLCGAAYYASKQQPLCLVSHINTNRGTSSAQEALYKAIKDHFNTSEVTRHEFRINARKSKGLSFPEEREDSQRTRSFLFLTLAALTARRSGFQKIISIAENGQFAIHLPLSPARVGPFSTHTADPKFVNQAEQLFKTLLGLEQLAIENPFIYLTKSEILTHFPAALHPVIAESVSCWKASRIDTNHCGVCIPCFTRRIALEHNGIKLNEYGTDLFKQKIEKLPNDDEGKRNIGDFLGFITTFNETYKRNPSELLYHFPELINEYFDYNQACAMYFRMTEQAFSVFENYPQLKKMIS